ncbi:hypothetical protein Sste5346_002014 [Sporothrix stenoceras]|uniref:Uncharacterized protein n=1 Tax=Sporothrix stenoceras TaxID=5173 RepID=A0ABR3ZJR1_9PEZI
MPFEEYTADKSSSTLDKTDRPRCLSTPEDALINAAAAGAYLLTDRSTLLRQTWVQSIPNNSITVFFEPTRDDDVLMNSCYSLNAKVSNPQYAKGTQQFLDFLSSPRGQDIIANYGVRETGLPLFAPVIDGFATTFLKGGRPHNGRWVFSSRL